MQIPFLVALFGGQSFSIVPILVGALSAEAEARYGLILSSHFDDPASLFVVSSDFCHWGSRFRFSPHQPGSQHIFEQIEALDREAMGLIEEGTPEQFRGYLERTGNTICGRHPIGVLMHLILHGRGRWRLRFNAYAQSSRVLRADQSSVSYASALVVEVD